tara:strand:- start:174 stop:3176 length:3003 start_codon:yes stop_codon:yes gene_type:complete
LSEISPTLAREFDKARASEGVSDALVDFGERFLRANPDEFAVGKMDVDETIAHAKRLGVDPAAMDELQGKVGRGFLATILKATEFDMLAKMQHSADLSARAAQDASLVPKANEALAEQIKSMLRFRNLAREVGQAQRIQREAPELAGGELAERLDLARLVEHLLGTGSIDALRVEMAGLDLTSPEVMADFLTTMADAIRRLPGIRGGVKAQPGQLPLRRDVPGKPSVHLDVAEAAARNYDTNTWQQKLKEILLAPRAPDEVPRGLPVPDDPEALARLAPDPAQMSEVFRDLARRTGEVAMPRPGTAGQHSALEHVVNAIDNYRYSNFIVGPATVMINAANNAQSAIGSYALFRAAAGLERAARIAPKSRQVTGLGIKLGGKAAMAAWGQSMGDVLHVLKTGRQRTGQIRAELPEQLENSPQWARVTEWVAGLGTRGVLIADSLFWQPFVAMQRGLLAGREAARAGLKGKEAERYAATILANWHDMPLFKGLEEEAVRNARWFLFQNEPGGVGRLLQGARARGPLRILIPFFRTLWNLASRGVDQTPVGAVGTAIDVARGYLPVNSTPKWLAGPYAGRRFQQPVEEGVAPLSLRVSQNAVGAAIMGVTAAVGLKTQGVIVGKAPDKKTRDAWALQGKMEWSVKIGNQYVPMVFFGPVAYPLAWGAAIADVQKREPDAAFIEKVGTATAQSLMYMAVESPLQAIETLTAAIFAPVPQNLARLPAPVQWVLAGQISALIPLGALQRQVATTTDPFKREIEDREDGAILRPLVERVQAGIPWTRDDLPISRREPFGREVANPRHGPWSLFFRSQTDRTGQDPTLDHLIELAEAGYPEAIPPETQPLITEGGVQAPLTREQVREYQRMLDEGYDPNFYDEVRVLVEDFKKADPPVPPADQVDVLKQVYEQYRGAIRAEFKEQPEQQASLAQARGEQIEQDIRAQEQFEQTARRERLQGGLPSTTATPEQINRLQDIVATPTAGNRLLDILTTPVTGNRLQSIAGQ